MAGGELTTDLPRSVTVRAPAKVNLQLSVGARRPDGYHDLVTVFQAVGLYDELVASAVPPGEGLSLQLAEADDPRLVGTVALDGVPTDDTNLACRAARLLAAECAVQAEAALKLRKSIPVAGGMAGGSADAAAALVACDTLWGTRLERGDLSALGARLGADVPFALLGGTALGTGTGTRLSPALARGQFAWVFVVAAGGLGAAEVYDEFDRRTEGTVRVQPAVSDAVMSALRSGDPVLLGAALTNDLQDAALELRPQLADVLTAGQAMGALGAVVSGSGPTVALLAMDDRHAAGLAASLAGAPGCRAAVSATGPVVGARVVAETW